MLLQRRLHCRVAQDSLASPVPPELADCYFLEEWQRLQLHWAELRRQRKTFERERRSFTDAAVRLSREVRVEWIRLQSSSGLKGILLTCNCRDGACSAAS